MAKTAEVTRVFRWIQKTKARINLIYGGAGSSKSYSMAQHIIFDILARQTDKRVLIVRKTKASIRVSTWQLMLDLLDEYGFRYYKNKTLMTIQVGTNKVLFAGLDDPEKLKSIEFCNYIWIEEATEITAEDYRQLKLRLRRKTELANQMYMTCNPISATHWIKRELVDLMPPNFAADHSTYQDAVKFLESDYIKDLEHLRYEDENFYKIYAKGQWGTLKDVIYTNWKTYDIIPDKIERNGEIFKNINERTYGIDWGYAHPFCLMQLHWFEKDYFIAREIIYQSHLETIDIISKMKAKLDSKEWGKEMFAGTDEPKSIQELHKAGFNVKPADTTVRDGINFCITRLAGFTSDSPNAIKEAQSYVRKKDKDGVTQEEPVKFKDDAMDAMRYAAFSRETASKPDIKLL